MKVRGTYTLLCRWRRKRKAPKQTRAMRKAGIKVDTSADVDDEPVAAALSVALALEDADDMVVVRSVIVKMLGFSGSVERCFQTG